VAGELRETKVNTVLQKEQRSAKRDGEVARTGDRRFFLVPESRSDSAAQSGHGRLFIAWGSRDVFRDRRWGAQLVGEGRQRINSQQKMGVG